MEPLGPSEFLDRVIILLASRHGADPNAEIDLSPCSPNATAAATVVKSNNNNASNDENSSSKTTATTTFVVDPEQSRRWQDVARDMQALAKSPTCRAGDLRIVSPMVDDAEAFSAAACMHRARFALYRMEKEQAARKSERRSLKQRGGINNVQQQNYVDPRDPKPSGFDITRSQSIGETIKQIMEEAQRRINSMPSGIDALKSIADGGDDDDEDEDGEPIQLYQPPYRIQTEEEAQQAIEMGHAEEELLNRVHRLQMEHFSKYRRWINLGNGDVGSSAPSQQQQQQQQQQLSTSPSKSQSSTTTTNKKPQQQQLENKPAVEDMSADDVAELLGKLNLGEHIARYRRTNGELLATMSKDDMRRRFEGDEEATDMLWHHLESKMQRCSSAVNTNTVGSSSADVAAARARRAGYSYEESDHHNKSSTSSSNNNNKRMQLQAGESTSRMKAIYDAIAAPGADLAACTRELDEFEQKVARRNEVIASRNNNASAAGGGGDLRDQLRQGSFQALRHTLGMLESGAGVGAAVDSATGAGTILSVYERQQLEAAKRPPRPSQQQHQQKSHRGVDDDDNKSDNDDEEDDELDDLTESYMHNINRQAQSSSSSIDARAILAANTPSSSSPSAATLSRIGGGRGGRGGAAVIGRGGGIANTTQATSTTAAAAAAAATSSKSAATIATAQQPPARAGRMMIVEYDDEDGDDVE